MGKKKLAIIGARGMGHHGGFETVAAELAPRLSAHGYEVHCSTRASEEMPPDASPQGIHLMQFPFSFPESYSVAKMFEVLYDSFFVLWSRFRLRCDVTYCLGVAGGPALLLTRWSRSCSAVNVDGLEWTREKFGPLTKLFLRVSFLACCLGSDRIVLDNRALMHHVPRKYRGKAVCIAYGASPIDCDARPETVTTVGTQERTTLERDCYWLVVARLEPENNIHRIIGAYNASSTKIPLVIVGRCSSPRYNERLNDLAGQAGEGKKVILAGSIYDRGRLDSIRCGCRAYLHGHSVGGTNPSLLEAMSAGNVIVCHDNPFNREVASESAEYFSDEISLAATMDRIDADPSAFSAMSKAAKERIERMYRWDDIVDAHQRMFSELVDGS